MTVSFDRLWSTVMKWDLQIIALTYNNKINPESEYSWVLKKWVLKKQTLLKQTNFAQTNFKLQIKDLNSECLIECSIFRKCSWGWTDYFQIKI